jgi:hypothetical protein
MARPSRFAAAGLAALLAGCAPGPAVPDAPARDYIVRLAAAPLAYYAGGIEGLAPTRPARGGAPDLKAPANLAYLAYLKQQQAQVIARMGDVLGHAVTPNYYYYYALDGFTVRLTPAEAKQVANLAGVAAVTLDSAYPTIAPDGSPAATVPQH